MRYLFALLAWLMVLSLNAQHNCDLQLSGHVVDEHNDEALGFADIYLIQLERGTTTDEKGSFSFDDLCAGIYHVRVSHVGCAPDTFAISVQKDTHVHVQLEHHIELLELVDIEAVKPHEDIATMVTLDAKELATTNGQDLASVLDNLEGVQMLSTSGNIAKPMIHGLHSNRVVVMNDFVKIEGQQWGGEHAPELDPLAAESFEVVQGASTLRYGTEAIAGAIIAKATRLDTLNTRKGWIHFAGASNGWRGTTAGKLAGTLLKHKPIKFEIQGSLSKGGDLKAPDYYLWNTGSSSQNFQTRLAYAKPKFYAEVKYNQFNTDLGVLKYSHIGNLTDLELVLENGAPITPTYNFSYFIDRPYQHVEHEITALETWYKPMETAKLKFNVSRQYNLRQEFDNNIFVADESLPNLQYEITTYAINALWEHRLTTFYKYEVGTSVQQQSNTYEGRFFIPNFKAYQGGLFAINHLQFEHWETEFGLRYDFRSQEYFMYRNGSYYSPSRAFDGFAWNTSFQYTQNQWDLLINLGQAWRAPSANELFSEGLHHGASAIEFGDTNLLEERATTLSIKSNISRLKLL